MRAFAVSAALSLAAFFLPVLSGVPLFTYIGLPGVSSWSWVFTLSLSYVGQGMIMGLHTCVSMAAGAVLAWGIIGPAAQAAGWVATPLSPGPTGGRGFLLWISLAILLAETAASVSLTVWGMARSARGGRGAEEDAPAAVPASPASSAGSVMAADTGGGDAGDGGGAFGGPGAHAFGQGVEAGGVLGQTTPWAVDSTHPVFFRVLALLQVRPVCMAAITVVSLKKGRRATTTPKQGSIITAAVGCCRW